MIDYINDLSFAFTYQLMMNLSQKQMSEFANNNCIFFLSLYTKSFIQFVNDLWASRNAHTESLQQTHKIINENAVIFDLLSIAWIELMLTFIICDDFASVIFA